MNKKAFIALLLFALSTEASGQGSPSQLVKGTIVDRYIKSPLTAATVEWLGKDTVRVVTDSTGSFRIRGVFVGRQNFRVSYIGYKTLFINNILVESGKETVLSLEMEEDVASSKEIIIRYKPNKTRPINDLAMVSGRMFSVEETRRFAAGLNDPSRIATAFAGVSSAGDGNGLIIRGNAPNGLLWRMEGIDIPNPNHFARVGTSGGAISILSAQLLANSDFLTGAFPAEYGNALSGVFDIKLRKGNKEKREHTFSVSTIGIDFATEGYFKKGYGGSYLINYRYAFLTLMQKMGFDISDADTRFQDLSFHIHLPTKKWGSFSVFGFGGLSRQDDYLAQDSTEWYTDPSKRRGSLDQANTGAVGISHQLSFGQKTMLRTVWSLNGFGYREQDKRWDVFRNPIYFTRNNRFAEWANVFSSVLTHKLNKHHLVKAGVYSSEKSFSLLQREMVGNALRDRIRVEGNTRLTNAFLQWKWDPLSRFSFHFGIHGQAFALNKTSALEPRAGMRFLVGKGQSLSFGLGMHSQIQPLGNYFARVRVGIDSITPNFGLDFTRARHYVLGYAVQFLPNWNLRTELYYQWLHGVPILKNRANSYSVINLEDDFSLETLINKGKGQNAGIEFTLERYWNDQFYLLSTLSLYQSIYLPSDRIWRNTRYNSNSSFTLLAGKEWSFKSRRPSSLAIDLKLISAGGVRVTPIDMARSVAQKTTILFSNRIYEEKLKPIFRVDVQFEWKVQYKRMTGSFIMGMQNATNRKNQISQRYDPSLGKITYSYLLGRIPVFGYKLDF